MKISRFYVDYLTENYVDSEAKFAISLRAEMTSISNRPTNACESFYLKFNSLFYSHHQDIYF